MDQKERARLRVLCEGVDTRWARDMLALLGALDAADKQWALMADAADAHATRAERAEAELADEKRRHAELRAGVEALAVEHGCGCLLDGRPCWGCRARNLLSDATTGEPT